jgi:hypothetical protein
VGILSGSYPALYISAISPIRALRGSLKTGMKSRNIRMALTVLQFGITIMLIISLGIVFEQNSFVQNKKLGYDKEHYVVLPLPFLSLKLKYPAFKEAVLNNPNILGVAGSSTLMGMPPVTREVRPADAGDESNLSYRLIEADHDFLKTYNMEIIGGRDFSLEYGADTVNSVIINEETAKRLGLDSPVDARINQIKPVIPKTVVGVVRDFHLESLHQVIQPVIIAPGKPWTFRFISVRISPDDIPGTIAFIRGKWFDIYPGAPFDYSFFDEDFDALYKSEERLGSLFLYFTVLAILIASLGLFGLASFTAEQRSKEIGIRKVVGASVPDIVFLLLKEFAVLVLISNVLAWPVAYFIMRDWLENFAYRIDIGVLIFFAAAVSALLIAMIAVSFQAVKEALINPVEAIKYD